MIVLLKIVAEDPYPHYFKAYGVRFQNIYAGYYLVAIIFLNLRKTEIFIKFNHFSKLNQSMSILNSMLIYIYLHIIKA